MFTGLIEALGVVVSTQEEPAGRRFVVPPSGGASREDRLKAELQAGQPAGRRLVIRAGFAGELKLGESVAVNGACLTVIASVSAESFACQAGPETLAKTTFGDLRAGDRVNLERALCVGDRLGGHWVQGHVDGVGRIASRRRDGDYEIVHFDCPAELTAQMVPKGSIAVDGVSLTIVEASTQGFSVMLIPHTMQMTTLGFKAPGDRVNLETDILAKYAQKALGAGRP